MYTPISGSCVSSSKGTSIISYDQLIVSIGSCRLRAKFCSVPVRNACGK